MKRRIEWPLVFLAVALVVGGYFRFWNLTSQSLFLDEGFTFMVAGRPLPDMLGQIVYHDFHPPLFYLLTHYAMAWLHWPLWDYRYLTAPFGLITIVATWAIARRQFGDLAACVAALLVALEPSLIQWDRVYRMYSVMTAVCAVSWWLLLVAQEKTGGKRAAFWVLYGITAVVAPYIHYLGAVNVLCQGLYALTNPRRLWPVFVCGGVAALALLPWAWAIRIQYPNGGYVAGTGKMPIAWSVLARDTLLNGLPVAWARYAALNWILAIAVCATAAVVAWRRPRSVVPYWLGVAVVQILATLVTGKALVIPRYLLPVVPAMAITFGAAIAWLLQSRLRVLGAVAAVGIPALLAVCAADDVWDPFYQFPDWYLINLVVLQHEQRSDAMLFVQGFPYVVVGDFTAFRGHQVAGPAMPSDLPYTFGWLKAHSKQRVWYIENQYFYPDPNKQIKAYLDRTRKQLSVWSENRASESDVVNVILYGQASPAKRNGKALQRGVSRVTSTRRGLEGTSVGH